MVKDDLHKTLHTFQQEFKGFKGEMVSFKGEMVSFKDEMRGFRDEMREEMREVKEILAQHTHSLLNIEATLKYYGDMFQINKENTSKLDKRVATLEQL